MVGLDCAPPRLLYEELLNELPTLGEMIGEGERYVLVSSHPPITIPAWAVMVTGKSPGELGIYGFRHRRPGDIGTSYIISSNNVRYPTLWNEVNRAGGRSIVVSVPPSYPPKPVRGYMVSDFITPSREVGYTWPPRLKGELERLFGPYIFDVKFRTEEKDRLLRDLWNMTRQHFNVLRHLAKSRWDFMMFVEIGVDRVHHAFWKYYDREHPKHVPGNRYQDVIPDYYRLVDDELKKLLNSVSRDAVVVVASDHGAKAMKGAFAINQWLIEEGYLKLKKEPEKPGMELDELGIDWGKTIAWAWGGYYSRVFINLKGREPRGVVEQRDYEDVLDQLKSDIESIRGPNGERWETKVYVPRELYPEVRGDPPDLMVYLDNLSWRAAGTLGWPSAYLDRNDRGPDDAVHDWYGVFAIYDPQGTLDGGYRGEIGIENVKGKITSLMLSRR